jgi:Protein of unknown function (DUF1580)
MIDLSSERCCSLAEATSHFPPRNGKHISFPTIWRYVLRGIPGPDGQRVRLEAIRVGGRWVTSVEAVQRFAEALTPRLDADSAPMPRTPTQRRRNAAAASKRLSDAGI